MMHARSMPGFRSLKAVAGAAAVQGLTQLLMFASGIVVVRNLPIEQYAYYTLATAALGVATALSDSGMSNAVVAQSGRVWQQPDRLGAVLAAGLAIRRKVSLAAVLLLSPVLLWLATRQGSPLPQALLLCAALIPLFLASATTSLLEIPLRLHQRLKSLQMLQTVAGIARLACIALVSFAFPLAWLVVLSALFPVLMFNRKLRERSKDLANLRASQDGEASKRIKTQVVRSLPGAIYYVFVSQLTILLITLFGTTEGVAQVGALGRIAMVIAFLLMVFNMIALPRYARIPESESRKLLHVYLMLMAAITVASGMAVLFAWAAPKAVLFILGGQYSSLTTEVVLAVAAGGLSVIAAAASSLAAVRGTVVSPLISIPPSIAVQALLISLLPLDAVSSMFWLSISISGVQLVAAAAVFLRRLVRAIEAP
jgi:O-antigen/teichoic acid export membrane protein